MLHTTKIISESFLKNLQIRLHPPCRKPRPRYGAILDVQVVYLYIYNIISVSKSDINDQQWFGSTWLFNGRVLKNDVQLQ